MVLRLAAIATLLATTTFGCVADKGDEENPLGGDGKADSFYKPTEHGELVFGAPNRAEITEAEKFHAWTFTLTGDAKVSIKTDVSKNLDTVMYLYRRDAGSTGSFGSYVAKNDDHDGEIWSQIDLEGKAGEYRVLVKAFKSGQLGTFSVVGSCDGAGCPGPATCAADDFGTLPDYATTMSVSCATELVDSFTTRGGAENQVTVTESQVCTLDGLAKQSADLYRAYWQDIEGWDTFKNGETDISLDVATTKRGALTEVFVDSPFDEDAMSFTYGANGRLLTLFQDNESPDERAFCDETGSVKAPGEGCIGLMRSALIHSATEKTGTATSSCTASTTSGLPPLVGDPLCDFTGRFGIAETTSLSLTYRTWQSDGGLLGGEVKVTGGGKTATYVLGTTFQDTTEIFSMESGTTVDLACHEM